MLPDLVVHHKFYEFVSQHQNLRSVINLKRIHELGVLSNNTSKILFNDKLIEATVKILPYFEQEIGSGIKPSVTTFSILNNNNNDNNNGDNKEITMYNISSKAPRYVLWTKNDTIPICATCVDRIDEYNISEAILRITDWANSMYINSSKSIIVFDLDDTLIDKENKKLQGTDELLQYARKHYDLLVLWSHGSELHVDEQILQFDTKFDLILNNKTTFSKLSAKNLLYLYNYFPNVTFNKAILIDDSVYNYCPEYDNIFIPQTNNIYPFINLL